MEIPEPDLIVHAWYPRGVKSVIASGSNSFIGLVDENTVLKYPQIPSEKPPGLDFEKEKINRVLRQGQLIGLDVEEQILGVLGQHRRIIGFKGKHEEGLLLEHMPNGSIEMDIAGCRGCCVYSHEKSHSLHIGVGNLLLDKDLNIRLCDFQGRLLRPDGTIHPNGDSAEGVKSSMPRSDPNNANWKTDIFASGSAIYFMMKGHPPFPGLDPWKDKLEIVSRFKAGQFSALDEVLGGDVVKKCWAGEYESADEVVHDLKKRT
ncbi:uncharacterized protein K444DRAFT_645834 [Hyaloscypha bicolor E]|uniref:Protein kinase domain-containing protein n=1 Tax=Hyaloscypha bicolor E TaxID=1095630 RepID=A0A2J6SWE8_9HELO|nr:uncharacterized protein K444DRAFT_645834 [Hyaloscypha bicolor E]PMD54983.1 hypothetical protein K444DRAFT_645834 [Hyaloscypha bicolor E]